MGILREMLTYRTVSICAVGMPPSYPLPFSSIPWNEQTIKVKWWAYRRLKTNWKENLTKHSGSIHAYVKKEEQNRKSNHEKGGNKQKRQDP